MNNPIKIIYKVKNNNGKHQYYNYIYIGKIPNNISKILDKIKDLSIQDTLLTLTQNERKEIEKYYGANWFKFFFNKHHILSSFKNIQKNKQTLDDLVKKYGLDWVNDTIKTEIKTGNRYTYGDTVERRLVQHEMRMHRDFVYVPNEENYQISSKKNASQTGGLDEIETEGLEGMENYDDPEISEVQTTSEQPDEDDTEIYTEEDISAKELGKATSLIKEVMSDEDILKKKESKMIKFDTSKDTSLYEENLEDVFQKIYVTEQYIYDDDTIKMIKNKICCSIKNNPKFGKKNYLIPSRQYIWSEYVMNNKFEKTMIGTKWTQRNDILKVDVEPSKNIKVYEELRDQIKTLQTDLKRFNSKIRYEDMENNILFDYQGYYDNNELYLIDIYNEFGKDYHPDPEALTNLGNVFVKIYFPKIMQTDLQHIIDYLGNNPTMEREKISTAFDSINVDLLMENEIIKLVEETKYKTNYTRILKENFITQSMIHLSLHSDDIEKFKRLNLFKIFDDFVPSERYPFMQYMTADGNITFKLNEDEMNKIVQNKETAHVMTSWFQNVSQGMSFKIRMEKDFLHTSKEDADSDTENAFRFMTINISDLGMLEYKIQWKESDRATVDDISKTYPIVRNLLDEINKTSIKRKISTPLDSEFKTAFITTNQRFEFDHNYTINHNDLSKFARYFYPYFALVVEPRKRISKIHEDDLKGKYGTYLRYKRISRYENNLKIEQRIIYFMKNYEVTEQSIINEISKQFNITSEKAGEYLKKTMQKYPHVKKVRKDLKKFDNSPKYKSPGIDIEIQGKTKDKYKVRVSGARDKQQMERILTSVNVLLYLYMETYLAKKSEFQYLKGKLKELTNIAERRHIVGDFIKYSDEKINIKAMENIDKSRIGYKPEKGQSHWTRVCQNSGVHQKRRPQQFSSNKLEELLKLGYSLNKATGMYERRVTQKRNGKPYTQVLRAVKLNTTDDDGTAVGNEVFYTCSPEQNGIHSYIGFLTKSKNPNGEFMPCCFKKDQYLSRNEEKRNFFLKCIGKLDKSVEQPTPVAFTDQLYILLDTNKIQPKRFGFLPKILDFYLNNMLSLKRVIAQHYLVSASNGYFFKYGIEHGNNSFISAIATAMEQTNDEIIEKIRKTMTADKKDLIFTSLNNGDIRTTFGLREKYAEYLQNVEKIEPEFINHILTLPDVLSKSGINIVIFMKTPNLDQDTMKLKDNCHIICANEEETENLVDTQRGAILLYKEHNNYYPIFKVTKGDDSKSIQTEKIFSYQKEKSNIIYHIKDFYDRNCMERTIRSVVNKENIINAKQLYSKLTTKDIKDYLPKMQFVDARYKCRYIITANDILLPVVPSGSIYNLAIANNLSKYYDTYKNTMAKLMKFRSVFKDVPISPVAIKCDPFEKNEKSVNVKFIVTQTNEHIPIKPEIVSIEEIKKDNLSLDSSPTFENIDNSIEEQKKQVIDDRIKRVNYEKYIGESYELFRFIFSDYLNQKNNIALKEKITKWISSDLTNDEKNYKIKELLYRLIDSELLSLHKKVFKKENSVDEPVETEELTPQAGGKYDKFVQIIDRIPNLDHYQIKNTRDLCSFDNKEKCASKFHCKWSNAGCALALTKQMAITFVNKITSELIENNLRAKEILQQDDNYVSDVINRNYYTERPHQKVIKSTNDSIKRTIEMYFGKEQKITIGKQKMSAIEMSETDELLKNNPLKDYGKKYMQLIIPNNNTLLRAFANAYNWIENAYQEKHTRNLGHYGTRQTDIMVYMKSLIIDWMLDKRNAEASQKLLNENFGKETVYSYITKLASGLSLRTSGNVELFILNQILKIPIVVHDGDGIVKVFDQKVITSDFSKYENNLEYINLQFEFPSGNKKDKSQVPIAISVIYFK